MSRGQVVRLLGVMNGELSVREMMDRMEFKSRDKFITNYLVPALETGLVEMTQPDSFPFLGQPAIRIENFAKNF